MRKHTDSELLAAEPAAVPRRGRRVTGAVSWALDGLPESPFRPAWGLPLILIRERSRQSGSRGPTEPHVCDYAISSISSISPRGPRMHRNMVS